MKKRKIVFLFFITSTFFNISAQLNNFDLSKYKLPDLERRALETYFELSGSNDYDRFPSQTQAGDHQTSTFLYNGITHLNYNHYLNNSTSQRGSDLGFYFSFGSGNRKENKELFYKYSHEHPVIYYRLYNRKYYSGRTFFENDVVVNYQYQIYKHFSKNATDSSVSNYNIQTHGVLGIVPLKIGVGRIEPVQDARQAVYICDELSKSGRMSPDKTDEQIIEFARLISQLKNKRFFDSRLRRIAEIESIDSFLLANNYVSKHDAKYFTTLNDFWAYGNRPFRNSGTRVSFVLLPGYYYYNFNNPGDELNVVEEKYYANTMLIDGGVELNYEKPINLFWQNSIALRCYAGIIGDHIKDITHSNDNKLRIPNIQLGFSHMIGFYPNTRTDISFRYSVQYAQLFDHTNVQKEISGVEGKGAKATTDLSVNYYISPKFRLSFASSFYYIWQDSQVDIDFYNVARGNYMLSNFTSYSSRGNFFKKNQFANNFGFRLIYTIF